MAVIVTRHRTVLHHSEPEASGELLVAFFVAPPDDDGELPTTSLVLEMGQFIDMGQPEQVTLTVEPGDLLNELPEHYEPLLATATVEQLLNELHDRLADVGTDTQEVDQLLAELPAEVLSLRTEGAP